MIRIELDSMKLNVGRKIRIFRAFAIWMKIQFQSESLPKNGGNEKNVCKPFQTFNL